MAKPLVRLGIHVDTATWETLLKVERFDAVRTFDFLIDTSQPTVWLYLVGDSQDVFNRLHDIATKEGGLPMKSGGEWRESSEAFNEYFRAAVRARRLAIRKKDVASDAERAVAERDLADAVASLDTAQAVFESAFDEDVENVADHKESFEDNDIVYDHLGPAN